MHHKKHQHKILILGLIILTITLTVAIFYKQGLLSKSPVKLPLIIPTQVSSFKEFVNDKNNFKVSYPADWNLKQWDFFEVTGLSAIPEGSIRFQLSAEGSGGKFELLIWENRSKMKAANWVSTFLHEEIDKKKIPPDSNSTFRGINALSIVNYSKARKKTLEYIFFNDRDSIFELIFEFDDISQKNKIYDQIKESFTLTDSDKAQAVLNLAKKDLANTKNISEAGIGVTQIKEIQWSDSSLGCPKPGQMYLQVITPGYEITLSVKGVNYKYHTDLEKRVVFCP